MQFVSLISFLYVVVAVIKFPLDVTNSRKNGPRTFCRVTLNDSVRVLPGAKTSGNGNKSVSARLFVLRSFIHNLIILIGRGPLFVILQLIVN